MNLFEYTDAAELLAPDTRTQAQRWLDDEMERRGASEQGAEPYLILQAIALELVAERKAA